MIHSWVGRILIDVSPLSAAQAEGKGHRRRLRRYAIVSDAVVVVWIARSAGKVNHLIFVRASCRDTVARSSRVIGQLGPLNFRGIVVVDLAHPAFLRSDVLRRISCRILVDAAYVDNGVTHQTAGVAEHGR